jgi:hypothetical protein
MRTFVVVLLLVLAGCGAGSDGGGTPAATVQPAGDGAAPSTAPAVKPPSGAPMPEALSKFRCRPDDDKGLWVARGVLANPTKSTMTFQVTVYVGEATGSDEQARTRQVPNIAAGGSTTFVVARVPAPGDGGRCHVQVLARR